MKKQQNNSTRAWALQVALSIALLFISTVLLASSSNATPFTFDNTGSLATAREVHTATLLPNGKVLVAGGFGTSHYLASAELYDVGLGFLRPDWQPQIATATSSLITGSSLMLTGSRFQGISQASGGNTPGSSWEAASSRAASSKMAPSSSMPSPTAPCLICRY